MFPAAKGRFLLCLVVFLVNGSIAYFIASVRKKGISNYLLLILLGNMAIYIGYYHCMKLVFWLRRKQANEKINWVSATYFVKGILCWVVGVFFFASKQRATETTPALSRDMNGPCMYSIFDNHDVWHILSAVGIYCIYMAILTLEDCNLDQPWSDIHVF